MEDYLLFCKNKYNEIYDQEYKKYKRESVEAGRQAQKKAIRDSFIQAQLYYPNVEASLIWKSIYAIHVEKKAGILVDTQTIASIISADNSWKKSSGHAFEEMIKIKLNLELEGTGLQVLLQKDLTILLNSGKIDNAEKDLNWLMSQTQSDVFDLFITVTNNEKVYVFGCIQSKTSIRERVTRDREPSLQAMDHFFWSVAIVLDGLFLKMNKFIAMVNGGTEHYPKNGWHGLYVMSQLYTNDRIYAIDSTFKIFVDHAKKAANYWLTQRQWLNSEWRP